ncbi:transposase [Hungatella effluvii]|nr:transposase [Hungatella effluvii]
MKSNGRPFSKVSFRNFAYDLVWNRDYSISGQSVSLNTLSGRLHIPFELKGMEHWFSAGGRFGTAKLIHKNRKSRYVIVSWAFYQFREMLEYKAALSQSKVLATDPKYTSQSCPVCGNTTKANRNRRKHEFCCTVCGYRSNDDRTGAINIYRKGCNTLFAEACQA